MFNTLLLAPPLPTPQSFSVEINHEETLLSGQVAYLQASSSCGLRWTAGQLRSAGAQPHGMQSAVLGLPDTSQLLATGHRSVAARLPIHHGPPCPHYTNSSLVLKPNSLPPFTMPCRPPCCTPTPRASGASACTPSPCPWCRVRAWGRGLACPIHAGVFEGGRACWPIHVGIWRLWHWFALEPTKLVGV